MFEKCLHGKTQNANESFNGMMVFDTTAHCNNDEKDALDIMELLGIDSRYYMAKCCRSVNMRRTRYPFIGCRNHRKSVGRCCVDINVETEGNSHEKGAFEIRY